MSLAGSDHGASSHGVVPLICSEAMAEEFPFGPESIEAAYSSLIHEGRVTFAIIAVGKTQGLL